MNNFITDNAIRSFGAILLMASAASQAASPEGNTPVEPTQGTPSTDAKAFLQEATRAITDNAHGQRGGAIVIKRRSDGTLTTNLNGEEVVLSMGLSRHE